MKRPTPSDCGAIEVGRGVFKLYLGGGDWDAVFIEYEAGEVGYVRRTSFDGRKNTKACQKRNKLASEPHSPPVLLGPGLLDYG